MPGLHAYIEQVIQCGLLGGTELATAFVKLPGTDGGGTGAVAEEQACLRALRAVASALLYGA